mmetsp:Transcript_22050/g.44718  ORF Transcript_22050/g.44718 Transcript_22050/m.44718 type:complete len:497 (-) Transcript_22050:116-1606(-)
MSRSVASMRWACRPRRTALCHAAFKTKFSTLTSGRRPPLPNQFLEAYQDKNFDPSTHQRNDVPFDQVNGKPPLHDASEYHEMVGDGKDYKFSHTWIKARVEEWQSDPDDYDVLWEDVTKGNVSVSMESNAPKRVLWSNWSESLVRDPEKSPILFEYDQLVAKISKTREEERLMKALYQYGLVMITGTPSATDSLPAEAKDPKWSALDNKITSKGTAEYGILHLASIVGYHPLHTLYGSGVWSTSSRSSFYNDKLGITEGVSTADSAYGSTSLPLHTDMTYLSNPPGVQVFLMVQPASISDNFTTTDSKDIQPKGQSIYIDGFAAARQLLKENSRAFHILATTSRKYRCIDNDEGWHLEARGSVIDVNPRGGYSCNTRQSDQNTVDGFVKEWGPVKAIRHNDLDRMPDLPPLAFPDHESFYRELREAHEAWDDVLRRDEMRLVIDLQPGDCILVANQRVMHGRYSFETMSYPRVVMGCYVGMDELASKWRRMGFSIP